MRRQSRELAEYRVAIYAMDGTLVRRTERIRARTAAREEADAALRGAGVGVAIIEGRQQRGIWIRLERIAPLA